MIQHMEQRIREARARAAVRAWEFRQRRGASGVWFRLRRVLADASEAYSVGEADAEQLIREGYAPEPVGAELEPAKKLLFVKRERIVALRERTPLRVALDPQMLAARWVVLVRFGSAEEPTGA